jgi:hypothetical protein
MEFLLEAIAGELKVARMDCGPVPDNVIGMDRFNALRELKLHSMHWSPSAANRWKSLKVSKQLPPCRHLSFTFFHDDRRSLRKEDDFLP